jgi:hypothetical protein
MELEIRDAAMHSGAAALRELEDSIKQYEVNDSSDEYFEV